MNGILDKSSCVVHDWQKIRFPLASSREKGENRIRDDPKALIEREKSKKTYWISSNTFEEIIIDVIDEKGG